MKSIVRTISAAVLAGVAFGVTPAIAAVTFHSTWYANQIGQGDAIAVLPNHTNHFCYLSRVGVVETDTSGERAQCEVRRNNQVWLLEATVSGGNAAAHCRAYCYNNP